MRRAGFGTTALLFALGLFLSGCGQDQSDPKAEAPPPAKVEQEQNVDIVQVDHPDQFPLAVAVEHASASELSVTGTVSPDVSRNVPVVSLASGRVVEIDARLGDTVKKGQLLLRVQSGDISGAFSDYRKAVADEQLAHTQLERSTILYDKGAISQRDLEVAQDTENKAGVDVETTRERLRLLGGNVDHPTSTVDILAPVSGVIVEQNITASAGVKSLDNSPNLFTIADLSRVWIVCDVYENDLASVRVGDTANITLNAYPGRIFRGKVNNIGAVLDPSTRAAKVRIEVANPGLMRVGMFVTATFRGQKEEVHTAIPASAILHLHDRDWVFVVAGNNKFQRVQIASGAMLPGNMQEVISGIKPGIQIVQDALVFQNTVGQ